MLARSGASSRLVAIAFGASRGQTSPVPRREVGAVEQCVLAILAALADSSDFREDDLANQCAMQVAIERRESAALALRARQRITDRWELQLLEVARVRHN